MINWLNSNQGFVMGLLTAVYVATTAVMAWLMWRNLKILLDLDRRRSRPYILFDIIARNRIMYAVLKNTGLTTAKNVSVTVNPSLDRDGGAGDRPSPLTSTKVAYLAPGREFSDALDSGPGFFEKYREAHFEGKVSYEDSAGIQYAEPFTIDLTFQRNLLGTSERDVGAEIEKVGNQLERLVKAVSALNLEDRPAVGDRLRG